MAASELRERESGWSLLGPESAIKTCQNYTGILGVAAQAYNPSTQQTEKRGLAGASLGYTVSLGSVQRAGSAAA